jgi:hypothetical protein
VTSLGYSLDKEENRMEGKGARSPQKTLPCGLLQEKESILLASWDGAV